MQLMRVGWVKPINGRGEHPWPPTSSSRRSELCAACATRLLIAGFALGYHPHDVQAQTWPGARWEQARPEDVGMRVDLLEKARDYALTGGGSGMITRHGKLVLSWGDLSRRYDLKSTSKSIGVTALGVALADGKIELDAPATRYHATLGTPPEQNVHTGWTGQITVRQLANQTAGFAKPGGYEPLLFAPGTKWHYSDGGPNWLAECITLIYRQDVERLLFQRVFTEMGITRQDLQWRNHAYRPAEIDGVPRREFGSGVHANVNAMARIGYLYLRRGNWGERQLIPADFCDLARSTTKSVVGLPELDESHGNASDHYGLLWWNNADGTLPIVPRTAFWSWGLYDSLILVIPDLDVVVARAGDSWDRSKWSAHYDVLAPFFNLIVQSVQDSAGSPSGASSSPYAPSPVIAGVEWAPRETIVRRALGSDNWPMTWADDGHLYTAYGDGRGFQPFAPRKLSLGLARVEGPAATFRGMNIASPSAEDLGDGAAGRKASGMLMVDGTLYLWVRNVGNAQLGWSTDHAASWQWADWKFETSFGCPAFLNFGQNYRGARDGYAYLYSPDSTSAYQAVDQMVLARVPIERIRERDAYQFLERLDGDGQPVWTDALQRRGAVFRHAGRCYRGGISYHAGLRRYLWCQTLPESDDARGPRFQGGFGIYDAPEPWGPWTTVYFTNDWDVGPGETSCIPTKWISDDGRTIHLVFSGDDCFSVRAGQLVLRGSE